MNSTRNRVPEGEDGQAVPVSQRQVVAMGACYALGTFNDNFFKQAALLLAATAGLSGFQGQATLLFALPFVLFSAWAGWLADRLSKKSIIIWAKTLELSAMLVGAWGMVMLDWPWLLGMVFCMGMSSTLFSPSLNGSIPELFPSERVPKINALFKLVTTGTILVGIALAGTALDQRWITTEQPFGQWLVAGIALIAALVGLASTPFITRRPGMASTNPFPWAGPVESFRHLSDARRDPPLFMALFGEAFFYFLSTLLVLLINNLGRAELHLSYTATSILSVALLVGICIGSLLAARGTPQSWRRLLVPALTGIGLLLCCVVSIPRIPEALRLPSLFGIYSLSGLCGGLYLIPLTSFIQIRPAATDKGRILGASNCLSFTGILLAGQLFLLLALVTPSLGHLILGVGTLMVAAAFASGLYRLPSESFSADNNVSGQQEQPSAPRSEQPSGQSFLQSSFALRVILALVRSLLRLRYTVHVEGLETIRERSKAFPDRPILFLPSHPALIDPVIMYSHIGSEFRPRPLADAHQFERPIVRSLGSLANPVFMPDLRKDGRAAQAGVRAALKTVIETLRQGDNVLFYPSGGLTRTGKEQLGGNSGVSLILKAVPQTRIVLVRTQGLWGSSFSWASGKAPDLVQGIQRGCGWLLANMLFFMPRRNVQITFREDETPYPVESKEDHLALNKNLEAFYNDIDPEIIRVPEHFLQRRKISQDVPSCQTIAEKATFSPIAVPQDIRDKVVAFLQQESGVTIVSDGMQLAQDLGVDSLALTGISLWIEEEFGHTIDRLEDMSTVRDCLLAAVGLLESAEASIINVPTAWFPSESAPQRLRIPAGDTIPELVALQVQRNPHRLELADHMTALSYRETLLKALALAAVIRPLPGKRIGLMLPATPAAAISWLAVLLAGKTPVMGNWTTGERNFRHCMEQTGVTHVLSSQQLLERLARQGFKSQETGVVWVPLEELTKKLTWLHKGMALLQSRLCCLTGFHWCAGLRRVPPTAAILFTSGSEALPKAVPLSHANILANCRDIADVLSVHSGDRMLGMLPPFHSLGLTGNIVLPLVFGLPVVFHPNPTEAAQLADLSRAYRPTLLVSPPTFLDGLLRQARPGDLRSFRLGFVGAEKCPEHLYAAFASASNGVLCEGYGVTECSPVVSVNRPENVRPGSIGLPLPSVQVAIIAEDGEHRERVILGGTGMLLVRGPNVFEGYLRSVEQPFVTFEGQRWYRTGDLVSQDSEGRLLFQGRLKRFIKIGGEMISLPQIEDTLLEAFTSNASNAGKECSDGTVLAVESVSEDTDGTALSQPKIILFTVLPISREAANAALRKAGLSALFSIARVEQIEGIPLLGSGKVDYRQLKLRRSPEKV